MTGPANTQRNFHHLDDIIGMPSIGHKTGSTLFEEATGHPSPLTERMMRDDDVWYCDDCGEGPHSDNLVCTSAAAFPPFGALRSLTLES